MSVERVIRAAAKPLLGKLVRSLDRDDLYQVGRIALWQKAPPDAPASLQTIIARNAMRDELRQHRWIGRSVDSPMQEMASYDEWDELPDGWTDDEAASCVAVQQFLAKAERLTGRQRDVLDALASGLEQTEVARELGISDSRVSQHVKALREFAARYLECSAY